MDKTNIIELVRVLWDGTAASKRRKVFREVQKNIPEESRILFQELASHYFNGATDTKESRILILVHGIHTNGSWQQDVQEQMIGVPYLRVQELGYDLVTGFHFALFSRSGPIKKILADINTIKREEPLAKISVIAHSFGTYIISKILENNPDIRFEKIITCGSVISRNYNWTKHAPFAHSTDIINDVGVRDVWPVIANCVTLGYGSSGNQGFRTASATDRYFNYGHSDFFEPQHDHILKYWRPIFEDQTIPKSEIKLPKASVPLLWFCHSKKGKAIPFALYAAAIIGTLWGLAKLIF
ncbi:hypothetical protein [Pseudomonas sp. NPDC087626]|uniref:alpha/beta hydrolase n=1 Tax=Pseudomonas sp. NPDC087626 TaxID=3364444 RepID=UPI0037F47099